MVCQIVKFLFQMKANEPFDNSTMHIKTRAITRL